MSNEAILEPPTEFRVPRIIRSGAGAYRQVPTDIADLGTRRVLLVTDRNAGRIEAVAEIVATLTAAGVVVTRFDDIPGEPTTAEVAAGLASLRESAADVLLAIGGGSVVDTAKAVAALATNPGQIVDYLGRDKLAHDPLPLVAVATTAGTGSEVTRYTVITDESTGVKMLITDWRLLPTVAVADPLLTLGMPRWVTASTGIDALTHAIEAYVSRRATPTSDLFALGAIRDIAPNLYSAWDNGDLAARAAMMRGSLHAGIAFANASVALVHGLSRPIGAHFHVAHGLANAMLLPTVLEFSLPGAPKRYHDIAVALGVASPDDDVTSAGRTAVAAVADLCRRLEIPRLGASVDAGRLRELAPTLAADALASGSPANNPRLATAAELVDLYLAAL